MRVSPIPFLWSPHRPALPPLEGKPLMVHVVVNLEHWPFDQAMPRAILPGPHGQQSVPDVPNYSWVEYGMRCGLPRIITVLAEREVPASAACNASVIKAHPAAFEAAHQEGWEFIGHGLQQRVLPAEDDEREVIGAALDQLESFTGKRPRGWLGPGLRETSGTPAILAGLGIEYVCDWPIDDLPVWMSTAGGPLIAMPYALELNDSVLHAVERHPSSSALFDRLVDTLRAFDRELPNQPRVLTLGLHPHLIGVPHRICYLADMLDLLAERDDVIFVTGGQIADWYAAIQPFKGA